MDAIGGATGQLLMNIVSGNLDNLNALTDVAAETKVGGNAQDVRANAMAMFGLGGNFDQVA